MFSIFFFFFQKTIILLSTIVSIAKSIPKISWEQNADPMWITYNNAISNKEHFVVCSEEESINLHGLGLEKIPKDLVKSQTIQSISLHNNNIQKIPIDAFEEVPLLKCLNLAYNYISFDKLEIKHDNLKTLIIDFQVTPETNDVTTLSEAKINCPNVDTLSWRGITHEFRLLWIKMFPKLKNIYLSDSHYIQFVNETAISYLPNLRSLYLERNSISKFVMDNFGNIEILYLNDNPLEEFWINPIRQRLRILSLSNCSIYNMPELNIRSLESLDLSHNRIGTITTSAFQYIVLLENLNLDNNQLITIPPIDRSNNLKTLSLNYNYISNITGIVRSSSLKTLNLRGNEIENIDAMEFWNLKMLEYLDISHNKLKSLSPKWHKGMNRLKYLNLQYNNFINIEYMSIFHISYLKELYIKNNNITYIDLDTLSRVPNNCTIYVL